MDDWEKKFKEWKANKPKDEPKPSNQSNLSNFIKKEEKVIVDEVKKAQEFIKEEEKEHPLITKSLIFLAFAIPIAILLYALYINFLPFGYSHTYELKITNGTISPISNEFYLTNTNGRKLLSLNTVNGQINAVLKPKVVLKNAKINISIEGEGVSLATPIQFNPDNYNWTNEFDFTQSIPQALTGTATYNNESKCAYFNAVKEQTLSLPNSSDMFESGPMSIYIKWNPSTLSQTLGNYQQLMGHYNWELWQGEKEVQFRIGRANNAEGAFYSVSYPIKAGFFNNNHEALAIYSPSLNNESNGYIELWVDNQFAGRTSIGNDTIYEDYNGNRLLTMGWNDYNYASYPHFDGGIYNARISSTIINDLDTQVGIIKSSDSQLSIPIIGNGNLTSIKLLLSQ